MTFTRPVLYNIFVLKTRVTLDYSRGIFNESKPAVECLLQMNNSVIQCGFLGLSVSERNSKRLKLYHNPQH